jgi:S1-C subfamily serine protease
MISVSIILVSLNKMKSKKPMTKKYRKLKTTVKAALLSGLIFCIGVGSALAGTCGPMHEEMLDTAVRIDTSGSGTALYSKQHNEKWESYILTNYHVIGQQITIRNVWSPLDQQKVKRETREPVTVFWFDYIDCARSVGTRGRIADIVAHDEQRDLALLRLRDTERGVDRLVNILPEGEVPKLGQTVWATGAGLGFPPFISSGEMAFSEQMINGYRYQLSTAPIIFGNSGGALFAYSNKRSRYELVGVPSRVSASGFTVVSHMGWSIPTETVYNFLRENYHGFIVGDEYIDVAERKPKKQNKSE